MPLTEPQYDPTPVEDLQAEIRDACGAFDLEPMNRSGLVAGSVTLRHAASLEVAIVGLEARRVTRCQRSIRRDPGEHLFLLVQDHGHCRIDQERKTAHLAPGDMFLIDSAKPSSFTYNGQRSNQISVHLPRDEMVRRFGAASTGGVPIDRHDPLWLAMRALLARALRGGDVQPHIRDAFLCALGAYLHRNDSAAGSERKETVLSRALAMIDCRRTDPSFGPRELASHLNISDRMLQRHFEALGETPGRRLLSRRLELAHAKLSMSVPKRGTKGIASIAYDAGFNDLSYFYRAFRKKFGMAPGAIPKER